MPQDEGIKGRSSEQKNGEEKQHLLPEKHRKEKGHTELLENQQRKEQGCSGLMENISKL